MQFWTNAEIARRNDFSQPNKKISLNRNDRSVLARMLREFPFLPENFILSRFFLILLRSFAVWRKRLSDSLPDESEHSSSSVSFQILRQFNFTQTRKYRRVLENEPERSSRLFCDKSTRRSTARVQVQERNLKRDPRISPQNPERSEELGEPREALRDKRDLERSMESGEIAGKPRNCSEIHRISRDPSNSKKLRPRSLEIQQLGSKEILERALGTKKRRRPISALTTLEYERKISRNRCRARHSQRSRTV